MKCKDCGGELLKLSGCLWGCDSHATCKAETEHDVAERWRAAIPAASYVGRKQYEIAGHSGRYKKLRYPVRLLAESGNGRVLAAETGIATWFEEIPR